MPFVLKAKHHFVHLDSAVRETPSLFKEIKEQWTNISSK